MAGEKYLSIWNIVVWVVVIGAVIWGIYLFNGAETDVRGREAKMLTGRVLDCVVVDELIREGVLDGKFDIFEECSLDREMFEEGGAFYTSLEVNDIETGGRVIERREYGNREIGIECEIKNVESEFGNCYEDRIFVFEVDGSYEVVVTSGSKNQGRRG